MKKIDPENTAPGPVEKKTVSSRLKSLFSRENTRDFLAVFAGVFIVSLAVNLQHKPIDTHPAGGDCSYYWSNSLKFSKVWHRPFHYIPGLVFGGLGDQELQEIGFNHYADIDTFFRAPFYNTFLSLWIFVFGDSEPALLLSQNFLLGIMFGLMFLVLKVFTGRVVAFAGAVLGLFYIYFYLDALMTYTEIFQTIFFLLLFHYSHGMLARGRRSTGQYAWLAVLLWLYSLTKMPLSYLMFVLIPLFLYFDQTTLDPPRKLVRKETVVFIGLFLVLNFFSSSVLSRGMPSPKPVQTMGWRNYYAGACVEAEGFNSSTGCHKKEFRDNIARGRDSFWFNRYSEICKYAVLDTLKHGPFAYASMTFKKIWANMGHGPFQYSTFLTGLRQPSNVFHAVLLFLTVLFYFAVRGAGFRWFKAFLLLNVMYLAVIYGVSNPDPRYFFNFAPFYLVAAVVLAREFIVQRIFLKTSFYAACGLALLGILLTRKDFWGLFLDNADVIAFLRFLAANGLILLAFLALKLVPRFRDFRNSFPEAAALVFIYLVLTACMLDDRRFNSFAVSARELSRQIVLPSSWTNGMEKAFLVVDLRSPRTNGRSLSIAFNGRSLTNIPASRTALELRSEVVPPPYPFYEPHWIGFPVDPKLARTTNVISLVNEGNEIFSRKKSGRRLLPSFFHQMASDWIYGLNSTKDRRVYLPGASGALRHQSFAGRKTVKGDLNVFLVIKKKGYFYIHKQNDALNTAIIKVIALNNPLDNGLVFWSEKDPGADFERIYGNLANYLAGEYDRYRPPYLVY